MLHLSCLSFIIWLDAFVFQVVLFYFILFCFILWTASRFAVQLVLIWVVRKWILMRTLNESLTRPHLSKKTFLSPLTHGWMKNRHVSVFVEWLYHFGERFVFWQLPVDQFSTWHCSVIEIRKGFAEIAFALLLRSIKACHAQLMLIKESNLSVCTSFD